MPEHILHREYRTRSVRRFGRCGGCLFHDARVSIDRLPRLSNVDNPSVVGVGAPDIRDGELYECNATTGADEGFPQDGPELPLESHAARPIHTVLDIQRIVYDRFTWTGLSAYRDGRDLRR